MKKTCIIFTILLISLSVCAQFDFRKATWGMTREEVILSEDILPTKDKDNILSYHSAVEGELARYLNNDFAYEDITYWFSDGRLGMVEHCITPIFSNSPGYDHQKLYQQVSAYLESQYGSGVYKEIWLDAPTDGKITNLIYLGKLMIATGWLTERTAIFLIQAVDGSYNKRIYTSISYSELAEEHKEMIARYPDKESALEIFFEYLSTDILVDALD